MSDDALASASMRTARAAKILANVDFQAVDDALFLALKTPSCNPLKASAQRAIDDYLKNAQRVFALAKEFAQAHAELSKSTVVVDALILIADSV